MFRNEMSEMKVFGGGRMTVPKPSFKPAVEALEERIVLSAAPARMEFSAKPLPPLSPAVATRRMLHSAITSAKQFALAQQRLMALAVQMGTKPAGAARKPLLLQAQNLVAQFLKQENARFHQAQLLTRRVGSSPLFKAALRLDRLVHQNVLLINRQTTLFQWLGYTTFAANHQAAKFPRIPQGVDHNALKADAKLTPADADSLLVSFALILDDLVSAIPNPIPTDPCAANAAVEAMADLYFTAALVAILGTIVADDATAGGTAFFHDQVGTALVPLLGALAKAQNNANVSSSSFFPAHVTPAKPPPPLKLPKIPS
jgi:hypothetical protein